MEQSIWSTIHYTVDDGIATIVLNRPEHLNAFTVLMADEMIDALARAAADDTVRAVIVTGAGRAFCAGADLRDEASSFVGEKGLDQDSDAARDHAGRLTLSIFGFPKPVIAAINGPAVGAGATMTLAMDVRLASAGATFGFVFCRRGIVPEGCSTWFLPRLVGVSTALQWCYSGRLVPADEALAAGLLEAVCNEDELLNEAIRLARLLTEQSSPVSLALTRQLIWRMQGASHPMEAHRIESRALLQTGAGADAAEGVAAFFEKRRPAFPSRVSTDMPDIYPWWREPPYTEP